MSQCTHPECTKPSKKRGMCGTHYQAALRAKGSGRTRYTATCDGCAQEFASTRPDGKLCSDECRSVAYVGRGKKPRPLVLVTQGAYCTLPTGHPVMRYAATQVTPGRWWRAIVSGPCNWCGDVFTTGSSGNARWCSERCAKDAHDSKRGRFKIPLSVRLGIYARDAWTCQLCTEAVDPALMTLDPGSDWAPSLDHIECQAWSDAPDHSPDNLRLAHRWCNSVRGDGRFYTEADLRVVA